MSYLSKFIGDFSNIYRSKAGENLLSFLNVVEEIYLRFRVENWLHSKKDWLSCGFPKNTHLAECALR